MIVLVVDEVNRAAADFGAVGQHRLMDVVPIKALAAKGRNQRGIALGALRLWNVVFLAPIFV